MIAESSRRSRSSSSFSLNMTRARRSSGPGGPGGGGGDRGFVHFGCVGERDAAGDLACRGIVHVAEFAAGAGERLPSDEMTDVPHDRLSPKSVSDVTRGRLIPPLRALGHAVENYA